MKTCTAVHVECTCTWHLADHTNLARDHCLGKRATHDFGVTQPCQGQAGPCQHANKCTAVLPAASLAGKQTATDEELTASCNLLKLLQKLEPLSAIRDLLKS